MTLDIHAFIFDLDGVLTDTAEFHYHAWQRLADEEGLPFTHAENEALKGLSRRASLDRLLKGRTVDEETLQGWMTRKNDYYLAFLEQITPEYVLPGALALLKSAQAAGLKLAVASASRNAKIVLERLGIIDLFDAIGDGCSVARSKPAPDIFIWTAGGLGVQPAQCVVFEDSEAGIEGALLGGFYAVGIGGDNLVGAHVRVPSFEALHDATAIIAKIAAAGIPVSGV